MEIKAPSRWRCIDFISDIHLQQADHATFDTWRAYLRSTPADALFILGDLFEVWVGDDAVRAADGFESQCAAVLRGASTRLDLHIMAGNRDFLMGPALMHACNAVLLGDPTVLEFANTRIALTHGDALCLGDVDYQQFRKMVRGEQWQADFLAKSLGERQAIAQGIRAQSESHKQSGTTYADVDAAAAVAQLDALACVHMVHGHTHKPGVHDLGGGKCRWVLSDWVCATEPPRGDVLRLQWGGAEAPAWSRLTPATASRPVG